MNVLPVLAPPESLPLELYSVAQVRTLEQCIMVQEGLREHQLMRRAGEAAFALLQQRWPQAQRIALFIGGGNNGGDGWVVAELAKQAGLEVHAYCLSAPDGGSEARNIAYFLAQQAGVEATAFTGEIAADVLVDALLGIGLQGAPNEQYGAAIRAMNAHSAPIFALDVPSGLEADTGAAHGVVVEAHCTISFVALKQGLFTQDGPDVCGQIWLAPLSEQALTDAPAAHCKRITWADLQALGRGLPTRRGNSHKGDYGHVLVIGGDHGFGGAPLLTSEAAARSGAGLISCATRSVHISALLSRCPVVMAQAVESGMELLPCLSRATVLAVGPGLGQSSWSELLFQQVWQSALPTVFDADALNLLARTGWQTSFATREVVLTPHPGEAARLLGCSIAKVQADRFAAAKELAQRYQAVVVLKGQGSIVANVDGALALCGDGNPGMSSGGMGDVLTGVVASFLAQGVPAWQAACLAVCAHAKAADILAEKQGMRGILASDLGTALQELIH